MSSIDSFSEKQTALGFECMGAGLGLRFPHIYEILSQKPNINWLEIHICNFINGGLNQQLLYQLAEHYPLSFHGVSLNLGGPELLDVAYLQRLKQLTHELNPKLVSEHACFTSYGGRSYHDLLPVPYTQASVEHFCSRIHQVQETIGRPILIENLSRYVQYSENEFSEAEFLTQLCKSTGCGLLLDLTNAYVNDKNLGISVEAFIDALPHEHIKEIHLAGFSTNEDWLIDTHSAEIPKEIWHLLELYLDRYQSVSVLIERDNNIPSFQELHNECCHAQSILDKYR